MSLFLKLDGVLGESRVPEHIGEIELLSFKFNDQSPSPFAYGGGGSQGKLIFKEAHFKKLQDTISPNLWKFCADGKIFPLAIVTVLSDKDKKLSLTYSLTEAIITSIQTSGDKEEMISLNFNAMTQQYRD